MCLGEGWGGRREEGETEEKAKEGNPGVERRENEEGSAASKAHTR